MNNLFMLLMVSCLTTYSYANDWYLKTQLKINFGGYKALKNNGNVTLALNQAVIIEIANDINNNTTVANSLQMDLSGFSNKVKDRTIELETNNAALLLINTEKAKLDNERWVEFEKSKPIVEQKISIEQMIDDKTTTLSNYNRGDLTQQQTIINNLNNYYQGMIVSDALTQKDKDLLNQQKNTIDGFINNHSMWSDAESNLTLTAELETALQEYEVYFRRANPTETFEVPEVTEIITIFSVIGKAQEAINIMESEIKEYEKTLATLVEQENIFKDQYNKLTENVNRKIEEAKAIENSIKTINAAIKQLNEQIKTAEQQQTEAKEKIETLTLAKATELKKQNLMTTKAKLANEQYVVDSNKKINNYYLYDTYARLVSLGYNLNNNFAVELSLASANLVTSFNLTPKSSLYLHAGVSVYNLAEYGVGFKYNNISLGLMVQHPRNIVNNKFVYEGITFVNNFDTGLKVSTTLSYSF